MSNTTSTVIPIDFLPGFYKNSTPEDSMGYFIGGDKVRFSSGKPQKLGGYQSEIMSGELRGVPRTLHPFISLDYQKYLAVGTHRQLAVALGGMYFDITPTDRSSSLTDVITTSNGSPTVTITHTLHGARDGDTIVVDTPVVYNGVTISGSYQITRVDDNSYTITTLTNASSTGGPGGGNIDIDYLISDGTADTTETGFGWGVGTWGSDTWGTPRATGALEEARIWWVQSWGEDILALPRGGALYHWDTSVGTGTRAIEVSTAPTRNDIMLVSSTFRCVVLFGTETTTSVYDPLLIRWSNAEDYTDYDPLTVGTIAGEHRLTLGTKIISACETRHGEIVVVTDAAVYVMRPTTGDATFEFQLVSNSVGGISPKAIFDVDGTVFFITKGGFKIYNGTVGNLPTTLDEFIFDPDSEGYLNFAQSVKFYFSYLRQEQELWFWWADSSSDEINRYCILNIQDSHACDGTLDRTAYSDNGIYSSPYAYDPSGNLYAHEIGFNADGVAMESYLELGYYNVEEAGSVMFVDRVIPNGNFSQQMDMTIKTKKFPNDTYEVEKTYTFTPTKGYVSTRARGRYISILLRSNIYNGDFRLGKFWASVQKDGKR